MVRDAEIAEAASDRGPSPLPPNPLLSAPILPTLLRLAFPNLAAMLVTALVAIAETVYVGILGTTQLAAIALVFPLVMLTQMLSAGAMGGGVSSAISRALGGGHAARAEALALHAVVIGATTGVAFSVTYFTLAGPILRALGGTGPVLDQALLYAGVALTGAIAVWMLNTLASVVRGTGNMQVPSLTLLGASALQIALGGALGLGLGPFPRLGLPGVAAGLVVGYALGATFLLWFLVSGRARIRLRFSDITLRRDMFFDILRVGALAAFSPLQTVLTVLVLTRLVASFGTEALAGYGIGARLEFLLVPIVFGVGVASVPMVGMAIGAGRTVRARQVAWASGCVSAIALGVIGLTVALWPDLWSGLFTDNAQVRDAANLYLRWVGPGFPLFGLGLALYFASQGSGKVLGPVLAATVRLLVIVIGGWLLARGGAPLWSLFALAAIAMAVYGIGTAAAVRLTSWDARRPRT